MPSIVPQIQFRDPTILEKLKCRGATTINQVAREYLDQYLQILEEEQLLYGVCTFTDTELAYICKVLQFQELTVQTIPFMWAMLDDSKKRSISDSDTIDLGRIVQTVRELGTIQKFALADYVRQTKTKKSNK